MENLDSTVRILGVDPKHEMEEVEIDNFFISGPYPDPDVRMEKYEVDQATSHTKNSNIILETEIPFKIPRNFLPSYRCGKASTGHKLNR